jgi:hypothetical protein
MAKKADTPTPALTPELQQIKDMALAALKPIKRQLYTLGTLYAKVEREGLAAKAGFSNADDYWLHPEPSLRPASTRARASSRTRRTT